MERYGDRVRQDLGGGCERLGCFESSSFLRSGRRAVPARLQAVNGADGCPTRLPWLWWKSV